MVRAIAKSANMSNEEEFTLVSVPEVTTAVGDVSSRLATRLWKSSALESWPSSLELAEDVHSLDSSITARKEHVQRN